MNELGLVGAGRDGVGVQTAIRAGLQMRPSIALYGAQPTAYCVLSAARAPESIPLIP